MKSMNNEVQWRHEYKYLCNFEQSMVLQARAEGLLHSDSHTDEHGVYRIRSMYLDGYDNQGYLDNDIGVDARNKYRIRIYNEDVSHIVLEKKSKLHGLNHKCSCEITEEMCRTFMAGEIPQVTDDMNNELKCLLTEIGCKVLRPVVIVEYERTPFIEEQGNVRVTFDRAISSSVDFESFLDSDIVSRPIMQPGMSIMEVKWDSYLPEYIKKYMQLDSLKWSTFSKYYLCRKYNCQGGII